MKNLIITTPDTLTLTSDISKAGWITIGVDSYPLNNCSETAEIVLADMSSPFNSTTFSDNSFVEFEAKIIDNTVLFSGDFFPIGTYGINLGRMPYNILESSTLTPIQKAVIALAISYQNQNEDYYVVVAVTNKQTTFRNSLREYDISSATIKDIQRRLE